MQHKYIDPADQIVIHHIRALYNLYHAWPTDQIPHLEQAWQQIHQQLTHKPHPWYTVKQLPLPIWPNGTGKPTVLSGGQDRPRTTC